MKRTEKKAMFLVCLMTVIALITSIDKNFFFVGMCCILSSLVNTCHWGE